MKTSKNRGLVYLFVLGIGMLAIFIGYSESRFVPHASAASQIFIVFNTNDGGAGSLRQAILSEQRRISSRAITSVSTLLVLRSWQTPGELPFRTAPQII